MLRQRLSCTLAAALLLAVGVCSTAASLTRGDDDIGVARFDDSPQIEWQSDLRAAHRVAVRENKPMLLVWGADWCGFCKKLERQTLTHPQLAEYINGTFVAVHMDFDRDEKVRDILEVEKLPCTIVLTTDAQELERLEGYAEPQAMYRKLAGAQKLYERLNRHSAAVE